jgi:hypothetical protein
VITVLEATAVAVVNSQRETVLSALSVRRLSYRYCPVTEPSARMVLVGAEYACLNLSKCSCPQKLPEVNTMRGFIRCSTLRL